MREGDALRANAQVNDPYEVSNQLGGYVGPNTEKTLANFLIRQAKEACKLADEISNHRAALLVEQSQAPAPVEDSDIRALAVKAFNEAIDADGYEASYEIIEKALRNAIATSGWDIAIDPEATIRAALAAEGSAE